MGRKNRKLRIRIPAAENEIAQLSCLKGNLKANIRNI